MSRDFSDKETQRIVNHHREVNEFRDMLSAEVGGGHGEAEMRRGKWLKKYLDPDTKHKFLAARDLASGDYEKASTTSHSTQELHDLIDDGVKAGVISSKVATDLKKQIQRRRGEATETQPAFSRQGQLAPGRGTEHRQKAAKILSYLRQRDPATARGLRSHAYGSDPENRGKIIYARNSQTRDDAMEQLGSLVEHGYKDRVTGVLTESSKTNIRNTRAFRENVLDVVKKLKNSLGASAYASGSAAGPRATFRFAARDAIKKVQAISKSPRSRDHSNRPEFHQALRDIQKVQYGYVKYPEVNYNKQGQANPETKVPRHLSGHRKEVVNKAIERPIEVVSKARWSSNYEHNRTTGVFNKQRVSQKLTPIASAGTVKETDRSNKMTPDKLTSLIARVRESKGYAKARKAARKNAAEVTKFRDDIYKEVSASPSANFILENTLESSHSNVNSFVERRPEKFDARGKGKKYTPVYTMAQAVEWALDDYTHPLSESGWKYALEGVPTDPFELEAYKDSVEDWMVPVAPKDFANLKKVGKKLVRRFNKRRT